MKIAIGSDGKSHLTDVIVSEVKKLGHDVELFGALTKADNQLWPKVAEKVGTVVASGEFKQGILCCWTGTGISIAANKVSGVRAALCWDVETAKGARIWNDANILALSMRSTSEEIAKEILKVWFETSPSEKDEDRECFKLLKSLDKGRSSS